MSIHNTHFASTYEYYNIYICGEIRKELCGYPLLAGAMGLHGLLRQSIQVVRKRQQCSCSPIYQSFSIYSLARYRKCLVNCSLASCKNVGADVRL